MANIAPNVMFLPRPQFHVNYYGGLDNSLNGAWLNYNKVIGNCETNIREHVNFGADNTVGNNDQSCVSATQNKNKIEKKKTKKAKKNNLEVNGQFEGDQIYFSKPQDHSAHLPRREKMLEECLNSPRLSINKNRNRSLIDAYKPPETSRNELIKELQDHLNIGLNSNSKIGVTVTSKYKSSENEEHQMVKGKVSPHNNLKQSQHLEQDNHTKGGNLSKIRVLANRVSVTRDPVNAQRIQQCEQAKLMARYASDKTGISLTDIYTGRISFTEKPKVKPEVIEEKDTWQSIGNTREKNETVCFTQPVANPEW